MVEIKRRVMAKIKEDEEFSCETDCTGIAIENDVLGNFGTQSVPKQELLEGLNAKNGDEM